MLSDGGTFPVGVIGDGGVVVSFNLLSDTATSPRYCSWNDSSASFSAVRGVTTFQPGFIIYAVSNTIIEPSSRQVIDTEISINVPNNYSGIILDAPGTTWRHTTICEMVTLNHTSVLPIRLPLLNTSSIQRAVVRAGEPVGYIVLYRLFSVDISRLTAT